MKTCARGRVSDVADGAAVGGVVGGLCARPQEGQAGAGGKRILTGDSQRGELERAAGRAGERGSQRTGRKASKREGGRARERESERAGEQFVLIN